MHSVFTFNSFKLESVWCENNTKACKIWFVLCGAGAYRKTLHNPGGELSWLSLFISSRKPVCFSWEINFLNTTAVDHCWETQEKIVFGAKQWDRKERKMIKRKRIKRNTWGFISMAKPWSQAYNSHLILHHPGVEFTKLCNNRYVTITLDNTEKCFKQTGFSFIQPFLIPFQ